MERWPEQDIEASRDDPGDLGGDALVAALGRWAADQRMSDAVRRRTRERGLREVAARSATLDGVLTDLAERRADVIVQTPTRTWKGRLAGVARDFCVLEEPSGAAIMVVTGRLLAVTPTERRATGPLPEAPTTAEGRRHDPSLPAVGHDPSGDRRPPIGIRLLDALAMLADDRSPVRLAVVNGELLQGDLLAVGADLLTIRLAGPSRRSTHLRLAAVEACCPC